jgi:hypothetical protein
MRNDRTVAWLWLASFLLAGTVGAAMAFSWRTNIYYRGSAAMRDVTVFDAALADHHLSILWLGDTMLGDALEQHLEREGYSWPFEHVKEFLTGDFIIANAEAPITARTVHWNPDQRWSYHAHPASAVAIAETGIHALGLANNHTLDRGPDGLLETLEHARAAGLLTIGAGATIHDAEAPLLVRSGVGTVGIVAIGEDPGRRRSAAPDTVGIFALNRTYIHRGIQLARRAGADWVVAYVHWGKNYSGIDEQQRIWARLFADAGYDLVVGHHPHVVQPIEFIDGMPVVYSLGNFIFGTRGRYTEDLPGYSLMLTTEVGAQGPERLRLRCILADNKRVHFQPRPCAAEMADSLLRSLHVDLTMEGGTGVLPWSARRRAPFTLGRR